ncbi:uncharacterized protein LOC144666489 [Oculina patagonica]
MRTLGVVILAVLIVTVMSDSSPCSVEPKDRVLCGEGFELHVENLCKRKGCCFRYDLNFGEKCFHPREPVHNLKCIKCNADGSNCILESCRPNQDRCLQINYDKAGFKYYECSTQQDVSFWIHFCLFNDVCKAGSCETSGCVPHF